MFSLPLCKSLGFCLSTGHLVTFQSQFRGMQEVEQLPTARKCHVTATPASPLCAAPCATRTHGKQDTLEEPFCLFSSPGLCWTERCPCCWLCHADSASLRSPGIHICASTALYHLAGDHLLRCCEFSTHSYCDYTPTSRWHITAALLSRFHSHRLKSLALQTCSLCLVTNNPKESTWSRRQSTARKHSIQCKALTSLCFAWCSFTLTVTPESPMSVIRSDSHSEIWIKIFQFQITCAVWSCLKRMSRISQ